MANNIKAIREKLGISQKELSGKTGINQPKLSLYEKADELGNITVATLLKISEALNCSLNDLITTEGNDHMKNYKECEKKYIGSSDMAALLLVGFKNDIGAVPQLLRFGSDGSYDAYICEGETEIGSHYTLVAEYQCWLKIYDDQELVREFKGKTIRVYRAGEKSALINIL